MTESHHRTIRQLAKDYRPRGRTIALIVGTGVAVVCIASLLSYRHVTDPERIRRLAAEYLGQFTSGRVTVGSASTSWLTGVRLFDVTIEPQDNFAINPNSLRQSDDAESETLQELVPVFACREVRLVGDWKSILLGEPDIESVVAIEPTCTILRDRETDRINLSGMLRMPASARQFDGLGPTVELRDARIRVIFRETHRHRLVEDLRLTIRARPSPREADTYDVVWRSGDDLQADGHSRIDLRTGHLRNVQGGLPWMSIEAVMAVLNVRYDGAGAWCDLLGLDGTVRAKDYHLSGDDRSDAKRSATIELDGASISIPVSRTEITLPADQRYLRFDDVNGAIELTANGLRADFAGLLDGSECAVSADFRGGLDDLATLDDVDFDARVVARGLHLPRRNPEGSPAEIRFIERWSRLQRFYGDYDPHGPVDLDIAVAKRAGVDEPIVVRNITVSPKGADMSARFIPYRLRNVVGEVEYTPKGVIIRDLRGQHDGGTVTINGFLDKPTKWAAKQLTIEGERVPIDDALYQAMPQRFRKAARSVNAHGRVDVTLRLTQPSGTEGAPEKWQSDVTVLLRNVKAQHTRFPYLVEDITGTLTARQHELELRDVAGRSGRALIDINGVIRFPDPGATVFDLALDARALAVDSALLAALPENVRERIAALCPAGTIDVRSNLSFNADQRGMVHETSLSLRDVSIRPDRMPLTFQQITGEIRMSGDCIEFDHIAGRYNDATVFLDGFLAGRPGSESVELTVRGRDVELDDPLRSILPRRMRRLVAGLSISGPLTTETVVRSRPPGERAPVAVRTNVRLHGANVRLAEFPEPFQRVRGEVVLENDGIRASNLQASYGPVQIRAALDIGRDSDGEHHENGELTLVTTGAVLDESFRGLLPDEMAWLWDRLDPRGSIDLHIDKARFERHGLDNSREWSLDGYVEFNDVALRGVADVQRMSGTIMGSGTLFDRRDGTMLTGSLALSSLDLLGQPLTRTESNWSYARVAAGEAALAFDSIRGRIHEGSLTGRVQLRFDPSQTEYSLATTVHGMQIEPFVHRAHAPSTPTAAPIEARGLLDGQISLSGTIGDPSQKRGRGRCEIRDGHMYRVPLILAIAGVLNLTLPDAAAFDDLKTDFFVVGNRVQFKDILLRNSALALVGSGSMTIPDRGINLDLINVSPHHWARVPVLAELFEGASRELMELHVNGPLARPTVRARPLPAISEEIRQLFQKRLPRAGRTAAR